MFVWAASGSPRILRRRAKACTMLGAGVAVIGSSLVGLAAKGRRPSDTGFKVHVFMQTAEGFAGVPLWGPPLRGALDVRRVRALMQQGPS